MSRARLIWREPSVNGQMGEEEQGKEGQIEEKIDIHRTCKYSNYVITKNVQDTFCL